MLIQPSVALYERIINQINREEKLAYLKKRIILELFGLFLSGGVFIWLSFRLFIDLAASGLVQYLSLLFTDSGIIMADIGDYALSLLGATPALSLTLALATLLALTFCLAKLADIYTDFKNINRTYAFD